MCGIAGAFGYRGQPIDADELLAMRDAMRSRGPDGHGLWISEAGQIGLAHRRLSILDLSDAGAQPMDDGRFMIVFNGEIYNHHALRKELEARGRKFISHSDTEVLLALFAEEGPQMLGRLRGMYAFAIWDREARRVFLARDPFGIKPLYYAEHQGMFRFASQVKALLRAGLDTTPEPAAHVGFLLWGSVPDPLTLYRGVRALPAGHFMWIDEGGVTEPKAFADPTALFEQAAREPSSMDREEALCHLSDALRDSVAAHLVSDVPVGVFLSAGMDSALLAAEVAALGSRLCTVTLSFDEFAGGADDEAPLASEVASVLGAEHATVRTCREDFLAERERFHAAMDQPTIDGINTWFVARAAVSRGLKVVLSGLGGDELFASYPSFRHVPWMTRWLRFPAALPGIGRGFRFVAAPILARWASPKYAGLIEFGGDRAGAYLLRRGLYMPWELPDLMDPDMAREGWMAIEPRAALAAPAAVPNPRLSVSALETTWYMRNQLLRDADWAGMAHSLEIRVPLVDWKLLAKAAPIFGRHPDVTKREVVAAAAPNLPSSVLSRPKTGFNVPVREWIGAEGHGARAWARQIYTRFTADAR